MKTVNQPTDSTLFNNITHSNEQVFNYLHKTPLHALDVRHYRWHTLTYKLYVKHMQYVYIVILLFIAPMSNKHVASPQLNWSTNDPFQFSWGVNCSSYGINDNFFMTYPYVLPMNLIITLFLLAPNWALISSHALITL